MFIQKHAKILATSNSALTSTPSNSVPKQYGCVSQTLHANATLVVSTDTLEEVVDASNTSSDEETTETARELACVLQSHKATHDAEHFLGVTTTIPHTPSDYTVCVNVHPSKVYSLVSRLSPWESVVMANGGFDTGLLSTDWYVLEYTGQHANVVGFDEFVA